MKGLGYVPSVFDGSEFVIGNGSGLPAAQTVKMPDGYSYRDAYPYVIDQGQTSTCVPCSITSMLDWKPLLSTGSRSLMSRDEIYSIRADKTVDGMTFKEALSFIKHNGYLTEPEYKKFREDAGNSTAYPQHRERRIYLYGRLMSLPDMIRSLMINGPFVFAVYVHQTSRSDFWNGPGTIVGGHAMCCVGFDNGRNTLLIRNSWGTSYADKGYAEMKYSDAGKIVEAWGIIR